MKYILYPIATIICLLIVLFVFAPLKFIWHLVWHFEIISFRHATSFKDEDGNRISIFPSYSFKEIIKEIFIYNYEKTKI